MSHRQEPATPSQRVPIPEEAIVSELKDIVFDNLASRKAFFATEGVSGDLIDSFETGFHIGLKQRLNSYSALLGALGL